MDAEERALEIKLSQLSTKLQVNIASIFGFLTVAGVFIAVAYPFLIEGLIKLPFISTEFALGILFSALATLFGYVSYVFSKKTNLCQIEIESLKLKYFEY